MKKHEIIFEIVKNKKFQEKYIKNKYPEIYQDIINYNVDKNISWLNKLYDFIYEIKVVKCKNCNCILKFKEKFSIGYGEFCSVKCTSQGTRNKVKQTNLNKYGVEYPLQSKDILNKVKQTNLNKYGVESTLLINDVKNKIKQTVRNKYGVDNVSQSELIKERRIQTNLEKFGVKNAFQNKNIIEKIKNINKNKSYVEKQNSIEKAKQTNLEKLGVESVLVLDETRNKIKQINLEKLGVEFPFQSKDIRNKIKKTIKNRYGVDNISNSESFKDKINKNIIKKWAKNLNIDINDIDYINNVFTLKKYCKIHDKFEIKYDDLYNRFYLGVENICTKCNPISKQSKIKENEICDFIKSLNFNFIRNNRNILDGKEIDIYIPEHKLAIEFDGLYWHSNKYYHYKYHLNKTKLCEQQEIQLLHIFEDEWIYKKEIVKSIIKSKLGVYEQRIYARKCKIKEITDNNIIHNFLENNHLQGFIGSNSKIGLFYDNELVSLMTFGKKRKALGNKGENIENEYEMYRFCNKLNTQVIGGASKLLKYFINTYKPKNIITFADRRYSNGKLYKELGFEFKGYSKPNYWYFKKSKLVRYHRFKFRKDTLVKEGFDLNKTEHEIMIEKGYLRIYDCGNIKFQYNYV